MKKTIFIFAIFLAIASYSMAQGGRTPAKNHIGIGGNLNNFQNDFGLGVNVTSPYFFQGATAFRVHANYMWLQHTKIDGSSTVWTPYYSFQFGTIGGAAIIANFLRLYGEGGLILLLPNKDFSSNSTEIGGYGVFGFEFFMSQSPQSFISYFIELGGMGTGAKADKAPGKPVYSNGFSVSVGFRFYL